MNEEPVEALARVAALGLQSGHGVPHWHTASGTGSKCPDAVATRNAARLSKRGMPVAGVSTAVSASGWQPGIWGTPAASQSTRCTSGGRSRRLCSCSSPGTRRTTARPSAVGAPAPPHHRLALKLLVRVRQALRLVAGVRTRVCTWGTGCQSIGAPRRTPRTARRGTKEPCLAPCQWHRDPQHCHWHQLLPSSVEDRELAHMLLVRLH